MFELIADIADRIKIHFPELEKVEGIGRRDEQGRILQQIGEMNEFKYSGLDDRSSNYFYIRHRESGQFTYEQTDEGRVATCERVKRVSGRFSLVLVSNKVNAYEFEDKATRALISLDQCSRPGVRPRGGRSFAALHRDHVQGQGRRDLSLRDHPGGSLPRPGAQG